MQIIYNYLILIDLYKLKAGFHEMFGVEDPAGGQPFEKVAKQIETVSAFNQPVCPDF